MTDVKLKELAFTYEDFKAHCDCDFGSGDAPQHDEDNCQIGGIIYKANRILAEKLAKCPVVGGYGTSEWSENVRGLNVIDPHTHKALLVCIREIK